MKMYEIDAWAVGKDGKEIGGGYMGDANTMEEAVDRILPYLRRSIVGGGTISGNIRDGFKFEDPKYDMADCTISVHPIDTDTRQDILPPAYDYKTMFIIEHQAGAGSQFSVAEDGKEAERIVKRIMIQSVDNQVGDILKVRVIDKYEVVTELRKAKPKYRPKYRMDDILPNDVEIEVRDECDLPLDWSEE